MALTKPKKYDWKDSNLSLFGSDLDKKVKKGAASSEPAWEGAGQRVGLQIWRIVKFMVTDWPVDDYGKFYNGDSYIILNTYKENGSDELKYDVHFWIGEYSTQDEYGTAAYKTVELDTLLDDKPVQHREVMDHESALFKSYFKRIELLEGGAESGFRHVGPQHYQPRLLHFHGTKQSIEIRERPLNKHCLDSTDVFILDLGNKAFQWNGSGANKDERFRAALYINQLKTERNGRLTTEVLDEINMNDSHIFYTSLSTEELSDEETDEEDKFKPCLYRLSDENGPMEFTLVCDGVIPRACLDPMDVFIADTGKAVFVWIGSGASKDEKKQAMAYAHQYLQTTKHPLVPVTCLNEGSKNSEFEATLC